MTQKHHAHRFTETEETIIVLFCLIDGDYNTYLNPRERRYESLKRLSDSGVIILAVIQQLRDIESERSFLRDAEKFFLHLLPRRGRPYPFLLPLALAHAKVLLGILEARDRGRADELS